MIFARVKKRKRCIKKEDQNFPDMKIPNLVKDLSITQPNQVWRTDFTHLVYRGMVFYLATVIDDFTKEIVGYSLGLHHTKEFVLEALKNALQNIPSLPKILHSDQ